MNRLTSVLSFATAAVAIAAMSTQADAGWHHRHHRSNACCCGSAVTTEHVTPTPAPDTAPPAPADNNAAPPAPPSADAGTRQNFSFEPSVDAPAAGPAPSLGPGIQTLPAPQRRSAMRDIYQYNYKVRSWAR